MLVKNLKKKFKIKLKKWHTAKCLVNFMNKYDNLKFLKDTKARKPRTCDNCGHNIKKGTIYYKESIGKINAPGIILRGFCETCHVEQDKKY